MLHMPVSMNSVIIRAIVSHGIMVVWNELAVADASSTSAADASSTSAAVHAWPEEKGCT